MFDTDVMVLTGAGASIPVGIPGMAGMVREFKEEHSKRSGAWRAYEAIREYGVPDDLEEVLQFCNRLIELRDHRMTRVVHHAVAPRGAERLEDFKRRFSEEVETAEGLREELIRWIGDVCLQFDRDKAAAIYGDLVPLLAQKDVPVFTTNYDGVLDEVAELHGLDVADNFEVAERGRRFWNPTHQAFSAPGLKIVKMHGSIYWHATKDNSRIEKLRQPARRNAEGQLVEQLLIFPTRFKDIYQQNYFPLYSAFTRTLGCASTLIVVGHSLRDEYLLAAIRERSKDASFSVVVVDVHLPKAAAELPGRVVHLNGGIQTFAPLVYRSIGEHLEDGTMVDYLENAVAAKKRGRKEKIQVEQGVPQWVDPGENLKVRVSIETLTDMYTWGAFVQRNRKWETLFASGGSDSVIRGFGIQERELEFSLPEDLERGESYTVSFVLFGSDGNRAARVTRKVRIKKA